MAEPTEPVEPTEPTEPTEGPVTAATLDTEPKSPADFPDEWRQKLAGDDDKALKRLERFASPADLFKAYREAENKIRSGEKAPVKPGEGATDEEIAAYREQVGVPDKPEGYLEKLDGVVIGDDDKEMADAFLKSAHAANAPPEFVNMAMDWYFKTQEEQATKTVEEDRKMAQQAIDDLNGDWGREYRANINTVTSLLDSAGTTEDGEALGDLIKNARLSNGVPLLSHPDAIKWLHRMANEINPAGTVVPGDSGKQIETIDSEIESIRKEMVPGGPYWKDEKKQTRYRELIAAKQKLSERAA